MADALILGLLAMVDLGFLVYLRQRRGCRLRRDRMKTSLVVYVHRENGCELPKRRRLLLKAS
ncbi:MAG: hypothetical protein JST11_21485 [Acidobacteria bacterium]|nr:hypothetical protein [Acidobacteriota bacterium]